MVEDYSYIYKVYFFTTILVPFLLIHAEILIYKYVFGRGAVDFSIINAFLVLATVYYFLHVSMFLYADTSVPVPFGPWCGSAVFIMIFLIRNMLKRHIKTGDELGFVTAILYFSCCGADVSFNLGRVFA